MDRKLSILVISTVVALVLPVWANEKPSDAYQKAEKDLNAASNALRSDVKDIKYDALQKDADNINASLAVMLEYWKPKNIEDAVKYLQDGVKAAGELKTAAATMNYDGVLMSWNALIGSNNLAFTGVGGDALPGICVGCHLAHRQRLPDGSYEIK